MRRLLSLFHPITVARTMGLFGELEVRWETGQKVINSAHGNQSFGSLHRVWQATLPMVLIGKEVPREVLLLGLGGGSVPKILFEEMGWRGRLTAVELDPAMITLARTHFDLGRFPDLHVIEGDATIQVHAIPQRFDLVLVDLFDDLDLARGVDSRSFLHGLRDRSADGGTVCFNTVAFDAASSARCERVKAFADAAFSEVEELVLEGMNRMFILR